MAKGKDPTDGCCKHNCETTGSLKGGKFLDRLSDCQILKKDYATRGLLVMKVNVFQIA